MIDTQYPRSAPDYQLESLDGEMILFHPAGRTILHGNTSSVLIWQLCSGERTVAEIVDLLRAAYPEAADQIRTDVHQTLDLFASHQAIIWG
jgi:hypothetical protein